MLKRVFTANDEFTAITIREMLASQQIEALVRRFETTWLDGLPKMWRSGWGEVLVHEEQAAQAKELIEEFMKNSPSPPISEENTLEPEE